MKLTDTQLEELRINSFIFLENYLPELSTSSIAKRIGAVLGTSTIPTVQTLQPTDSSKNRGHSYSGMFGNSKFPLHSDLAHWLSPPRYLLLRCVVPDSHVKTYLAHFDKINEGLTDSTIKRALFKPRKRQNGKVSLLRYCEKKEGVCRYRWDSIFIRPDNVAAIEVTRAVSAFESGGSYLSHSFNGVGDLMIIDNWSMAHGRSEVTINSYKRFIERVYLSEIY